MLLHSKFIQRMAGGSLERWSIGAVARLHLLMLGAHKDRKKIALIKRIRRDRRTLITGNEAFLIHSLAQAQSRRPGAMAEVGVYEAASSKMICEAKGDRVLHLFDTFEGLPEATDADRKVHRISQYACSLESVKAYLNDYPNVYFHKGLFPASAADVEDTLYSFVHFDVDLYESTRACLEYFYPRMIPGGIMLSHDYSILTGVSQAFHEFLADKPEGLIDLPTTQCMVVKA